MRLLSCLGEAPVPFLCVLQPDRLASSELFPGLTADHLKEALFALRDLGLIQLHTVPEALDEITAHTLLVHPLVRDANRRQQDLTERRGAYASLVADLLVAAASDLGPDDPANWPLWRLLIPHCDSPLKLIDPANTTPRLLTQALRAAVAGVRHLFRVGWLDRAEAILDTCRKLDPADDVSDTWQKLVVPDAHDLDLLQIRLEFRSCTAKLLQSRGKLAEAETRQRKVLSATQASFGKNSLKSADARHALAELLDYRGRMAEAEKEYRAVFAARRSALGDQDPQTLAARKGVAHMSYQRGRLHEAEEEYRVVLDGYRRTSLEIATLPSWPLDATSPRYCTSEVSSDRPRRNSARP